MNNSNNSQKWTIGANCMVGWWIFCGICLYFDIFPMTPIVCCVAIVIGIILAFAIIVTITIIEAKKKREETNRRFILDIKYEKLKKKYPHAVAYYFREEKHPRAMVTSQEEEKYFSNKNYYKPEYQKYFDIPEDVYAQKEQEYKDQEERAIREIALAAIFHQQVDSIKTTNKHGLAIRKEKNKE